MTTTRDELFTAVRREKRDRRVANWIILGLFACLAFIFAGTSRWWQLLIVIVVATGLLRWVLWLSMRAYDRRKSRAALIIAALFVCLIPPLIIPLTYDAFLEPVSLMRVLILLIWVTIGFTLWTLAKLRRRQKKPLENAAWVGIVIAVGAIIFGVIAPLVGLSGVGKPQTHVVHLESICSNTAFTVADGILGELKTASGDKFSARSQDSEFRFEGVPYYSKTQYIAYAPNSAPSVLTRESDDITQEVMVNGDVRLTTPFGERLILPGYLEVLGSLLSSGYLQPSEVNPVTWGVAIECDY